MTHPFDAYSDAQKALTDIIINNGRATQAQWISFEAAFLAYREDMGLHGPARRSLRIVSERAVWPKRGAHA